MELENNNLEMELLYSEYVASVGENILENKLLKDTEAMYIKSIKQLHEETKSLQEKFKIIETRMNDIRVFSYANDFADNIIQKNKDFKGNLFATQIFIKLFFPINFSKSILNFQKVSKSMILKIY